MFKNAFKIISMAMAGILGATGMAMAQVDLTNVTLDTTTPTTLAATVLVGLGVIWGIRKLIKLVNRS
jgi:predicted tellurium resistance membrane protein TerC